MTVTFDHPVRFEDVDPAGLVFFPRYLAWCHVAMERFFDGIEGGYAGLIMRRRVGFPAVHVSADWKAPLRYGDVARIETSVTKIGTTSFTLRYVLVRTHDGVVAAQIDHVVVASDLSTMTKIPIPPDVRAYLDVT